MRFSLDSADVSAIRFGISPGHELAHAVRAAQATDVILVAGKGHEDYQDLGGQKHPFSDIDEARAALATRREVAA